MKQWISNIQKKTEGMDRKQKIEYIFQYYWHYMVLFGLFMSVVILCIYHVFFGRQEIVFHCVAVNQEINYPRDQEIEEKIAQYMQTDPKKVIFDCDYIISYGDVQMREANESSYEKFFLNWQVHALDMIIVPESFLNYCEEMGGVLEEELTLTPEMAEALKLRLPKEEPLIAGIPSDSKHKKAGKQFLEFLASQEP